MPWINAKELEGLRSKLVESEGDARRMRVDLSVQAELVSRQGAELAAVKKELADESVEARCAIVERGGDGALVAEWYIFLRGIGYESRAALEWAVFVVTGRERKGASSTNPATGYALENYMAQIGLGSAGNPYR